MDAVVMSAEGEVEVRQCPEPHTVAASDAVVKVTLAGICGSDLHIVAGRDRGCRMGTIMGHEFVGVVTEVGSQVARFRPGDRVVAPFTVNCGQCFFCQRRLPARCERSAGFGFVTSEGRGLEGAQAEFVRVPFADTSLLALPDRDHAGAPFEDQDALFLGDILSTAYGAADAACIVPGDVVAVVGCGPVGLLAIQAAELFQPACVVAVDPCAYRRDKAAALGALPCPPEQARALCDDHTHGRGADAVIEAVGTEGALTRALSLMRPGAIVSIAGYHTADTFSLPIQTAYDLNLTLKVGRANARVHMETLLPKVLAGIFRPRAIISHVLPLRQAVYGYEIFRERRDNAIKVLLTP